MQPALVQPKAHRDPSGPTSALNDATTSTLRLTRPQVEATEAPQTAPPASAGI
jgi:hypothetical protein